MRERRVALSICLTLLLASTPVSGAFASFEVRSQTPLAGSSIDKFVDELPRPARIEGCNDLIVTENEFQQKLLSSTFRYPPGFEDGTYVWGFGVEGCGNSLVPTYPGPTIVTHRYPREEPQSVTRVHYDNQLAPHEGYDHLFLQDYLTVDQTLHWADPLANTSMDMCMGVDCTAPSNRTNPCCKPYLGPVPATVHLHGAESPSAFDGHPDSWWTPYRKYIGPAFVSSEYTYINTQQPTALWYHDHALGLTRINIYAGLAAFYFIRGNGDEGVPGEGLNLPAGEQELEMAIADRQFDTNGQLLFPDGYPAGLNGGPPFPNIHPFWIPEFFGDTVLVNGKTWPKMTVEPKRYRFRLLNAANSRFFGLGLDVEHSAAPDIWVIGTDGGLLDRPVKTGYLLISPSERYDIIVDFRNFAGKKVRLINGAPAPFPSGTPSDTHGVAQVMQFEVDESAPEEDNSFDPAAEGAALRGEGKPLPAIVRLVDGKGGQAQGVTIHKKRQLVLNEILGPGGGTLENLLNNTKWNGRRYGMDEPVPGSRKVGTVRITELPVVGSTELWEIINLTPDAHPIHVHLGQFQLMNRQSFHMNDYMKEYNESFPNGRFIPEYGPPRPYDVPNEDGALGGNPAVSPYLIGSPMPPRPYEFGWKDVWVMRPGQVTRIVLRFSPQEFPVDEVDPGKNLYSFDPTATIGTTDSFGYPGGPGYIWHCHILDHEDNEMMRPYIPVNLAEAR